MENPYAHLSIYYFDGIPLLDPGVDQESGFLGTWVEEESAFLFFSRPVPDLIQQVQVHNPQVSLVDTYEMTGEQWHGDKIEPYFIEDLCIAPPWDRPKTGVRGTDKSPCLILLDPGVVFGTGRHPTTEACLALIHRVCSQENIQTVLDIGTGTGLLSLGAAARGCPRVLACDFNLLAVKTTLKNIQLNGFEDQILAFQAKGEQVMSIPCDLLVANIHYDVMQHLIEHPDFLEKPWFILSGLLNSETTRIMASLAKKPVHIMERRCPDGIWNTLLGRRL